MLIKSIIKFTTLTFLLLSYPAHGAESQLMVAVAANFSHTLSKLSTQFSNDSGVQLRPIVASTGKLYALIKNGAPFDLFLSADMKRPEMLFQKGLATRPVVYAKGRAVLWAYNDLCRAQTWREALASPKIVRLAVPNPKLAPYGAVVAPLLRDGQPAEIALVYGSNVNQAFQFAESVTGIGFTALSLALSETGLQGCYWPLPETDPVEQGACILKQTKKREKAQDFLTFLLSDKTKKLLKDYGYGG